MSSSPTDRVAGILFVLIVLLQRIAGGDSVAALDRIESVMQKRALAMQKRNADPLLNEKCSTTMNTSANMHTESPAVPLNAGVEMPELAAGTSSKHETLEAFLQRKEDLKRADRLRAARAAGLEKEVLMVDETTICQVELAEAEGREVALADVKQREMDTQRLENKLLERCAANHLCTVSINVLNR